MFIEWTDKDYLIHIQSSKALAKGTFYTFCLIVAKKLNEMQYNNHNMRGIQKAVSLANFGKIYVQKNVTALMTEVLSVFR